jgi:hypothetical protein
MSREDLRQLIINDIKTAHPQNADKAEAIVDHLLAFDFMQDEGTVAKFIDLYRRAVAKREATDGLQR